MSKRRRRIGAAGAIKAILVLQIAIAAVLFSRDIAGSLPGLGLARPAPALTRPVSPGDQTRRFDPARLTARPATPGQNLPPTGPLPTRLRFERERDSGALRLTGEIAPGDAERFADWLGATDPTGPIELNSPGGSVTDALAIGRRLRKAGADTSVGDGDICLSACPYILAAGAERRVSDGAYVGVHQHFFGESTVLPAFVAVEDIQRGQAQVMDYLDEMGIDPLLMRHSLATPADEIYILLPEELTRYRLATQIGS